MVAIVVHVAQEEYASAGHIVIQKTPFDKMAFACEAISAMAHRARDAADDLVGFQRGRANSVFLQFVGGCQTGRAGPNNDRR